MPNTPYTGKYATVIQTTVAADLTQVEQNLQLAISAEQTARQAALDAQVSAQNAIDALQNSDRADLLNSINSLNDSVAANVTALASKANASDVTASLALKANSADVNSSLSNKADVNAIPDISNFITQDAVDSAVAPLTTTLNNTVNYNKEINVPPSKGSSTFEPESTTNGYLHVRDDDLKVVNALVSMYASGLDASWTVDFVNAANHYGVVENIDNKVSTSADLNLTGKTNLMSVEPADSLHLEYIFTVKDQAAPSANLMWDVTPSADSYTFQYIDYNGLQIHQTQDVAVTPTNSLTVGDEHKVSVYKLGDKIFIKTDVNGISLYPIAEFSASASMHFGFLSNPNVSLRGLDLNPVLNAILPTNEAQLGVSTFSFQNSDGTLKEASKEFEVVMQASAEQTTLMLAQLGQVGTYNFSLTAGNTTGTSVLYGADSTAVYLAKFIGFGSGPALGYFAMRELMKSGSIPGITWDGKYPNYPLLDPPEYEQVGAVQVPKRDRTVQNPERVDANSTLPTFDPYTLTWTIADQNALIEFDEFRYAFLSADNNKKYEHGYTVYSTGEAKLTNGELNVPLDELTEAFLLSLEIFTPGMTTEQKEAIWSSLSFWGVFQQPDLGLITATPVASSNITEVPSDAIEGFQKVIKTIF